MRRAFWTLAHLLIASLFACAAEAATRFVTTGGSGIACTIGSPCSLATAVTGASGTIQPGDIVSVAAGTYSTSGLTVTVAGTAAQPIKFVADTASGQCPKSNSTNCPVELVNTGNGNSVLVYQTGSYVWWMGFEMDCSTAIALSGRNTNSSGSSPSATEINYGYAVYTNNSGVSGQGQGIKFINNVIHDCKQGPSGWGSPSTHGFEFNGNLSYNHGWHAPDRGHGHAMYTQNDGVAQAIIKNNIMWGGAGQCWQHYGGDTAHVLNYDIEQNFALGCTGRNYQNGGSMNPSMDSSTIKNNESTGSSGTAGCPFGCPGSNQGYYPYQCCFTNNVFQGNYTEGTVEVVGTLTGTTWSGNTWITSVNHGLDNVSAPGNADTWFKSSYGTAPPKPSVDRVKVYANDYVTGRCNIMAWNWDANTTITIPASEIAAKNCAQNGDSYEILDAQNWQGAPTKSGTFSTGVDVVVTVPNGSTPPITPLGLSSTVTVSGTSVTQTAGAKFPLGGTVWNGITVRVNGSPRVVSSVTDQTHLTLTTAPGDGAGQTFTNDADGDLAPRTTWPEKGAFIMEVVAAAGSTPTPSPTPTFTFTPTPIPATATPTNTFTPSNTPTVTNTPVAPTNTPTPTYTPSNTPTATATPASIASTAFEAESPVCTLTAPMRVQSDAAASGGQYVDTTVDGSATPSAGGILTCPITIPTTGDWILWVRVLTNNASADSMYFTLDEGTLDAAPVGGSSPTKVFDMGESKQPNVPGGCNYDLLIDNYASPATTYYWNRLNQRDGGGPCAGGQHGTQRVLTGLTAGLHTFRFYGREYDGTRSGRLDRFFLTTDPNYVPTDVTPTPTPVGGCRKRVICNQKSRMISVPCGSQAAIPNPCPWGR